MPEFEYTHDFTSYSRGEYNLPEQRESDLGTEFDVRGILHRDGSVICIVDDMEMLSKQNTPYFYQSLGCKTAVGMPFKDIATVDSIFLKNLPDPDDRQKELALKRLLEISMGVIVPADLLEKRPITNAVAHMSLRTAIARKGELPDGAIRLAVEVQGDESDDELKQLVNLDPVMIFNNPKAMLSSLHASRRLSESLTRNNIKIPVIHHFTTSVTDDTNELSLQLGMGAGSSLTDGFGAGIMIDFSNDNYDRNIFSLDFVRKASFSLLQGCRLRSTKTEFVSCPSCGRTLFDLQETTAQISEATGHLPGVTVAVMGCIVNGPGEMADADFGYVGTLPGKVDLYYGKEVIKKSIPNEQAVGELVNLIKEYDMWVEKDLEEGDGERAEKKILVT